MSRRTLVLVLCVAIVAAMLPNPFPRTQVARAREAPSVVADFDLNANWKIDFDEAVLAANDYLVYGIIGKELAATAVNSFVLQLDEPQRLPVAALPSGMRYDLPDSLAQAVAGLSQDFTHDIGSMDDEMSLEFLVGLPGLYRADISIELAGGGESDALHCSLDGIPGALDLGRSAAKPEVYNPKLVQDVAAALSSHRSLQPLPPRDPPHVAPGDSWRPGRHLFYFWVGQADAELYPTWKLTLERCNKERVDCTDVSAADLYPVGTCRPISLAPMDVEVSITWVEPIYARFNEKTLVTRQVTPLGAVEAGYLGNAVQVLAIDLGPVAPSIETEGYTMPPPQYESLEIQFWDENGIVLYEDECLGEPVRAYDCLWGEACRGGGDHQPYGSIDHRLQVDPVRYGRYYVICGAGGGNFIREGSHYEVPLHNSLWNRGEVRFLLEGGLGRPPSQYVVAELTGVGFSETGDPSDQRTGEIVVTAAAMATPYEPRVHLNLLGPREGIENHPLEYLVTLDFPPDAPWGDREVFVDHVTVGSARLDLQTPDAYTSTGGTISTMSDGLKWTVAKLPERPSETLTIRLIPRLDPAATAEAHVTVTCRLDDADVTGSPVTTHIQTSASPIVKLTVTGQDHAQVGFPIRYTVAVQNMGNTRIDNMAIATNFDMAATTAQYEPTSLNYVVSRGDYDSDSLTWSTGPLEPGATATLTVELRPTGIGKIVYHAEFSDVEIPAGAPDPTSWGKYTYGSPCSVRTTVTSPAEPTVERGLARYETTYPGNMFKLTGQQGRRVYANAYTDLLWISPRIPIFAMPVDRLEDMDALGLSINAVEDDELGWWQESYQAFKYAVELCTLSYDLFKSIATKQYLKGGVQFATAFARWAEDVWKDSYDDPDENFGTSRFWTFREWDFGFLEETGRFYRVEGMQGSNHDDLVEPHDLPGPIEMPGTTRGAVTALSRLPTSPRYVEAALELRKVLAPAVKDIELEIVSFEIGTDLDDGAAMEVEIAPRVLVLEGERPTQPFLGTIRKTGIQVGERVTVNHTQRIASDVYRPVAAIYVELMFIDDDGDKQRWAGIVSQTHYLDDITLDRNREGNYYIHQVHDSYFEGDLDLDVTYRIKAEVWAGE